jgi:hypothetical protein
VVVRNAIPLDHFEEIGRRIPGECGFMKVRVGTDEVIRCYVQIGEIAPTSAGDEDLSPDFAVMFEDRDTPAPLRCFGRAHESGGPGSDHDDVVLQQLSG